MVFAGFQTVGGVTGLSFKVGTKTPILFVHGMWEGAWYFDNWMHAAMRAGHPVYALNLRGHHDSRLAGFVGRASVVDYVQDVEEVMSFIGEPVVLVGHSLGGLISQVVAVKKGRLVKKLVLVASAPSNDIFLEGPVLSTLALRPEYWSSILRSKPLMVSYEDARKLELNNFAEGEAKALYERMVPESGRAARDVLMLRVSVEASNVTCPVEVIGGHNDQMIVPNIQRQIAEKFRASWVMYPMGHMIGLEKGWEDVVSSFLYGISKF